MWSAEKNHDEREISLFCGSKNLAVIGLILLAANGAMAEPTGKIVGKVTASHGEGLPGATIVIIGTKISTSSDAYGNYAIQNVPVGTYDLKAGMIGYKDSTTTGVHVISGQNITQDFKLGIILNGMMFAEPFIPSKHPTEVNLVELSKFKGTVFTTTMKEQITEDKNLLYCPAVQIAWNELQDRFIREPIRLEGNPPIVSVLNKRFSTKEVLPESCYVAMVDTSSQDFFGRLDETLQGRFGDHALPEIKKVAVTGSAQFLIFAYLFKDLSFPEPFGMMPDLFWFHSGNQDDQVLAFGYDTQVDTTKRQDMESQVQLLYENRGNFIIQIKTKSPREELILAKIGPKKTLLETIEGVEAIADKGRLKPPSKEIGYLWIPILNVEIKHYFPELTGEGLLNDHWKKWKIAEAIQCIRFRLKSERSYPIFTTKTGKRNATKSFIFDKPFLIYLKQKEARYPYYAMWVGNTELMSNF